MRFKRFKRFKRKLREAFESSLSLEVELMS